MTFAYLSPLANHLWQSTLCAAAAWLLTLTLRRNRTELRYWIWLAASAKFLNPIFITGRQGQQLGWRAAPAITQPEHAVAGGVGAPPDCGQAALHARQPCGPFQRRRRRRRTRAADAQIRRSLAIRFHHVGDISERNRFRARR
jgi:hypothetical protein